jgi:hypothetical protein
MSSEEELPLTLEEINELLLTARICSIASLACSSWVLLSYCCFRSLRRPAYHLIAMVVSGAHVWWWHLVNSDVDDFSCGAR